MTSHNIRTHHHLVEALTGQQEPVWAKLLANALGAHYTSQMLRSSYAELETKARQGSAIVVAAILIHMSASILSFARMGMDPLKMVIPVIFQSGFCIALFMGKGWARWILFIFNLAGTFFTLWSALSRDTEATTFYSLRAAACAVVTVLLLLPHVRSYIIWKNIRF